MTIPAEFQAVVLAAGKGSRMLEFTSGKPKCLLPIGSKPLIWYTLSKLQKSGFTEVIMIVLELQKTEIQSAIDIEIEKNTLNIKIDYVSVLDDKDDLGTADSLRLKEIQEKLKSDVLILSCDLITDVDISGVLNTFRKYNASVTTLFFHETRKPSKIRKILFSEP
ncbi:translation initiation factor eIF-2B subunit gamma-like [Sitophilus oryzae]|uniref:Translation initiation factor eIF2B subunit gamma n=1 Tax=Sitophilus oryzae TaxID=7048 RepID=A0A6J2YB62_SITOR|nr:translation initiation factor eIF-2B subunit gamma-like [Sitophilus oryzae]